MELFSKDSLWIRILSNSQIDDEEYSGKIVKRIEKCTSKLSSSTMGSRFVDKNKESLKSSSARADSSKIAHELCKEQTAGIIRSILFNGCRPRCACKPRADDLKKK